VSILAADSNPPAFESPLAKLRIVRRYLTTGPTASSAYDQDNLTATVKRLIDSMRDLGIIENDSKATIPRGVLDVDQAPGDRDCIEITIEGALCNVARDRKVLQAGRGRWSGRSNSGDSGRSAIGRKLDELGIRHGDTIGVDEWNRLVRRAT
jgi:hypothetical protein